MNRWFLCALAAATFAFAGCQCAAPPTAQVQEVDAGSPTTEDLEGPCQTFGNGAPGDPCQADCECTWAECSGDGFCIGPCFTNPEEPNVGDVGPLAGPEWSVLWVGPALTEEPDTGPL
jgi:hypothetical protein